IPKIPFPRLSPPTSHTPLLLSQTPLSLSLLSYTHYLHNPSLSPFLLPLPLLIPSPNNLVPRVACGQKPATQILFSSPITSVLSSIESVQNRNWRRLDQLIQL